MGDCCVLRLTFGGAELETGFDCMGDPAQAISFSLRGTECCVVEGLWFPLGVRGVEREVDRGVQAELLEPSAEGSCVGTGLTDLAVQCKTVFVFLRGTQCRVAEKSCLPLVVREVDRGMQAELLAPSVRAEGGCVDTGLTDLVVQCRILFILRGAWCCVDDELYPSLVVGEGGRGMQTKLWSPSGGEGLVRVSAEGWAGSDLGRD